MKHGARLSPSLLLSIGVAIVVWAIFSPGLLSGDSLYTYKEAVTGRFTDVRPPLITLMLFLLLKAGGTLGLFTLLECLLGYLGVRRLLLAVTGVRDPERKGKELHVAFGILVLSSPLTPMPIYFVTLWFDSWLAIFLLWTIALLLELSTDVTRPISELNYSKIIAVPILITLIMLARWNSIILYLPLILAWSLLLWDRHFSRIILLGLALSPLIVYSLFLIFQYNVIGVRRTHTERIPFALDLAGMITYDSSVCQTLPLQSCALIQEKISAGFIAGSGAIDNTMNQGLSTTEPAFIALVSSPSMPAELWTAATHYPWTYFTVKVLNFLDYVRPRDRLYYQSFIPPNNLNLYLTPHFEHVRNRLFVLLHAVYKHRILKFFSFVHFPWILVNLIGVAFGFIFRRKSRNLKILGVILCTPLAYYLSYLLAMTSSDYRYMYPATLTIQVVTIGFMSTFREQLKRGDRKFRLLSKV